MKTLILSLGVVLAIVVAPAVAQKNKISDVDAIKEVIGLETRAHLNVDYRTWAEQWWHVPYAYWSYSDSTHTTFIHGWNDMVKSFDQYFKTNKPSNAKITNDWIEVRVYGTGAYARFVQRVDDNIDRDETSQVRVLEKKDGKWKIVCVGAIAMYPQKK